MLVLQAIGVTYALILRRSKEVRTAMGNTGKAIAVFIAISIAALPIIGIIRDDVEARQRAGDQIVRAKCIDDAGYADWKFNGTFPAAIEHCWK